MNCRRKKNRKKKDGTFYVAVGNNAKYIWGISISGWTCRTFSVCVERYTFSFALAVVRWLAWDGWRCRKKSENEFVARRATFARLEASTRVRFIEDEMNRQNLWLHYSFSSRRAVALIRWTINVNFPAPSTMPRYVRNLFPFKAT